MKGKCTWCYIGVYISNDLSWATHCECVVKKANRHLYATRQLKKCGVPQGNLVSIYCSIVRSILENVSVVFANLPEYLSQDLERIQRRALAIIFPLAPYVNALTRAGIPTLQEHRTRACTKFVQKVSSENPLHPLIHKSIINQSSHYNLRTKPNATLATKTNRFGNFVSVKYAATVSM